MIRVYKAPVEWQRVLQLDLVYGMFIVAVNGLFGYQQDALLTDGEAICRKAGPPGAITPAKFGGDGDAGPGSLREALRENH
jgi:hypothetical protein